MLSADSITSLTLASGPAKLWAEWLWLYFDGTQHWMDGSSVVFPDVALSFDQGDLRDRNGNISEPLSGVGISVVQQMDAAERLLNETGRTCWEEVTFNFIVRCDIAGKNANKGNSNYQCRLAAELLHGLLSNDGAVQALGQKGIMNLEPGKVEPVPTTECYTRMIRVRGELFYEQKT